jgi:D-alanyl-D-alanine carboxypeptidase
VRHFSFASLLWGVLLNLLLAPARAPAADAPVDLSSAGKVIERALATSSMPGLVVAITDRQQVRKVVVHGYADVKTRQPLVATSRFGIGSISKAFTAIALMELADEGRFDPQAPIVHYLPTFAVHSHYAAITGQALLSHTAGLPSYLVDTSSSRYVLVQLKDFTPTYAPGTHWWYSNTGFQVLGYALEDIEGMPYHTIIQRRVLERLGMSASASVIDDSERGRMAVSYMRWPYDGSYVEFPWFEYAAGDSSVVSDAADMCAYVRFYLNRGAGPNGRVLSEAAFTKLTTPILNNYAYGLEISHDKGVTIIKHGGGIAGYHSEIEAHLQDGFGLVFLSNGGLDGTMRDWIVSVVTAAFHAAPLPPVPASAPDPYEASLTDYTGVFGPLQFTIAAGHLVVTQGKSSLPLERMGPDMFRTPNTDADAVPFFFGREQKPKDPAVIEVSRGLKWYTRNKTAAAPAPDMPAEFAAYVGHYSTNGPEGPVARVFVRGGHLMMMVSADEAPELQSLEPVGPGAFRVGEPDYNPERAVFDAISGGRALRLTLTGVPLYRKDTP